MPQTVFSFRLYCRILCAFYLLLAGLGVFLLVIPAEHLGDDDLIARLAGGGALFLGLLYFAATFLGLHMPRRPGAWRYNLALILLGFTSLIFLPFGVILMVRWQAPEVRDYYHANLP